MGRTDDEALAQVARALAGFAGLDPPGWVLEARARERAAENGLELPGYATLLSVDREELAALAEALRVGETRFFRHRAHIDALAGAAIPTRRAARGGQRIRAWSAGCASGEEAWSLAILLAEAAGAGFEVIATDLSELALGQARAGLYAAADLEEVPPEVRLRWFVSDGELMMVAPALRGRVRFERRNLLDPGYPTGCDLILCRNVLIYFDPETRYRVIDRLADSLVDGGYLFLGYSETLRTHEARFVAERLESGVVIYKKRAAEERASLPPPVRPATIPPPRVRTATLPSSPPPPAAVPAGGALKLRGSYGDGEADRLGRELRPLVDGLVLRLELDGAEFLGDDAARMLARAAEGAPERPVLAATRAAVRRWIERHRLDERFSIDPPLERGAGDGAA